MNKWIVIGVLALMGIGGGVYWYTSMRIQTASPTQTTSAAEPTAKQTRSLRDLLTLGAAQRCTNPAGTVYISGGKMRGDFGTTHMITDNGTSYMWTDGQTKGFKMSLDSSAQANVTPQPGQVNVDEKTDYDCGAWTVDTSVFSLPAGVQFTDFSSIMVVPSAGVSGAPSDKCAACASLSGETKTQCLIALGCN